MPQTESRPSQHSGSTEAPLPPLDPAPAAVTWRSVLLGAFVSAFVAALSPFNDFVVANSFLVGSYLPPFVVGVFFCLAVFINAPLQKLRPAWALRPGELAVVMAMLLVACAVPGQGLMRQFIPLPVAPFYIGASDNAFWRAFLELELPHWLFPVDFSGDPRTDLSVRAFYARLSGGESIPWSQWLIPLAAWGVFIGALFATLLALSNLIRRQWAQHERLAFPLANLQLSMIEAPEPGRLLNRLFRARSFWISGAAIFFVQSLRGLHAYFPKEVPEIPISWDLGNLFTEEPWRFFHYSVKTGTIYFTLIAVCFFIQSRVALSLWLIFLLEQCINVQVQMSGATIPDPAWRDQHLGASVVFVVGIFWIGRSHWMMILRQAVGRYRQYEPRGDFISYRVSAWIALACMLIMGGWLVVIGVSVTATLICLAFLVGGHIIISRIVAETGLPFMRVNIFPNQIITRFPVSGFSGRDVFMAGTFYLTGTLTTRESLMAFATHGMTIADGAHDEQMPRSTGRKIFALFAGALLLSFVVGTISSLWSYYNYAAPLKAGATTIVNDAGSETWPREFAANALKSHDSGRYPPSPHNAWTHMGIGAAVMAVLQAGSWRWTGWPLAPVGYLVTSTWYIQTAWFSIFLGWLAKILIVRFGGAQLYQAARPAFIGLIVGEALAAGVWLLINLILALNNYAYYPQTFLPT
jgi:hypothetical protein